MIYLKSFYLPTLEQEHNATGIECPGYPYTLFSLKDLYALHFSPITMICGGNGSGKSTLLNMIAEKLGLHHESAHYTTAVFQTFVNDLTSVSFGEDEEGVPFSIPKGSRLIAGDDIVSAMLCERERNSYLVGARAKAKEIQKIENKKRNVFRSMEDYDALCEHLVARNHAPNAYASLKAGDFSRVQSNGETAIEALRQSIRPGRLYLLDEPENSMAPKFQAILAQVIAESAKYFDCQFIIATHSPFLMAMPNATLYDLDRVPVCTRPWYQFEAMRDWYALFAMHREEFEG